MDTNLFGEVVVEPVRKISQRNPTRPKGYAAPPGSGPAGETCRSCKHYVRKHYHRYVHLKCGLMQAAWTHGPGSDIRASSMACKKWETA